MILQGGHIQTDNGLLLMLNTCLCRRVNSTRPLRSQHRRGRGHIDAAVLAGHRSHRVL